MTVSPRLLSLSALGFALGAAGCSDYAYEKIPDASGSTAAIEVAPTRLQFAGLEQGEVGTQSFTITSIGDEAVDIGEISVTGSAAAFTLIGAPSYTTMAPGESVEVTVDYSPTNAGDLADVHIANSDPGLPQAIVQLEGVGLYPQLVFDPNPLDFGYVPSGTTETGTIDVVNNGGATLDVSSLLVLGEGFSLGDVAVPFSLAPGESLPVDIDFTPSAELRFTGEIWAESNTPGTTSKADLLGTSLEKPVAVCEADPSEAYALYDRVNWLGSDSYDPTGQAIVGYEWRLVTRPEGSAASMPGGTTADRNGFVADVVGEYVAELVVANEDGVESEPCYATLTAVPSQSLWVEMYWELNQDDMDLHLVDAGGGLRSDSDCYYANCVGRGLDWGVAGESSDNPSLDIDDIPGTGPENINIQEPAEGSVFTVYVHDYMGSTPDRYEANEVTVNIYISGELAWTDTRPISGDNDYVPFALIDWDARSASSL